MSNYIDDIFGPHGVMSHAFEGYEPRVGQVKLAQFIDKAIVEGRHLLSEAPTGTGKSLAYLVPSIYHTINNGYRVIVSTANIALQEQLYTKDLPMLQNILPWSFTYALIKGRSNYLCIDKWIQEQVDSSFKNRKVKKDRDQYRALLSWAKKTSIGDISELDFTPAPYIWHLFSSTSDECKGSDCSHNLDCLANNAYYKASMAKILITNYHLLFAHLQVRMKTGKDVILPKSDVIICDEAHKAPDIARDFFGFKISEGSVKFASRLLGRLGMNEEFDKMENLSLKFFSSLRKFYRSKEYSIRFRSPPPIEWIPMKSQLLEIGQKFQSAASEIHDPNRKDEKTALIKASSAAERLAHNLEMSMTVLDNGMVYYVEENSDTSVSLMGKPIFVSNILNSELFLKTKSVITTSATMSVGNDFSHMVNELGMPNPMTIVVDSPFDFNEQAVLIIPDGIPDVTDKTFSSSMVKIIEESINLANGRTLCLFTSYKNLEETWKSISGMKYKILKQGDKPRTTLIEEFKKDINSVLLGTESFWTGIDIPGESLSCLIIDRLPFQTPDDPILNAISERKEDWFMSYSVPKAVISFKQGFGRLIRRSTDRGVVVLLDNRIIKKPYGKRFLLGIPNVKKSKKIESIGKFLGS